MICVSHSVSQSRMNFGLLPWHLCAFPSLIISMHFTKMVLSLPLCVCVRVLVCVLVCVLVLDRKKSGKGGKGSKGITPKGVLALQGVEKSKLSGGAGGPPPHASESVALLPHALPCGRSVRMHL